MLLFSLDLAHAFPLGSTLLVLQFGFSSFVALLYLVVGLLVWLYAANRLVAGLLYAHSLCMSYTFSVLVGANQNDPLLSALSTAGSALALAFFYLLLLCFPRNILRDAFIKQRGQSGASNWRTLALWGYTCLLLVVGGLAAVFALPLYLFPSWLLPAFLRVVDYGYYAVALLSIVVALLLVYRRSYTPHERQQYRLFVGGVVAAFVPFLVLTALPLAIGGTAIIDGQISAATGMLLPLALGYSVLRYQLLIFEFAICQAAKRVVGVVALGLLAMIVCVVASIFSHEPSLQVIWTSLTMCVLGPAVWWGAGRMTERLFFWELLRLRKRLARPLINQRLRVDEVAVLLADVLSMHFETQELALFVFQEEMGGYVLAPSILPLSQQDEQRRSVAARLLRAITPGASASEKIAWIAAGTPVIQQLAHARRPLLLSELACSTPPREFAKFLSPPDWMHEQDLLVVPIRSSDKLLGVLALGLRAGRQRFSGVDFEALDLFLSRFSPILQATLAREQAYRQSLLLSKFFVNSLPSGAAHTFSDAAWHFAEVAAAATGGGAEIWHYREGTLLSLASVGNTGLMVSSLFAEDQANWTTIFGGGGHTSSIPPTALPPCLREQRISASSFAWLPLLQEERRVGTLLLTYGRPHSFLAEERILLQAFADHCARAFCSAIDQQGLLHELTSLEQRRTVLDAHLAASLPPVLELFGILAGYLDMLQVFEDGPWSASCRTHAGLMCEELALRLKSLIGIIRVRQGLHRQRGVKSQR